MVRLGKGDEMKKKLLRILGSIAVLGLAAILAWTLWPHTVASAIPNRVTHSSTENRTAEHTVAATHNFSVDPAAYFAFSQELGTYRLRADPRSLLPFFYQPSETVHSRVHVARVEATQPYSTDLLWDGDVLWIAVSRNHYLAYHPVREVAFETAWERFVSEYEQ